MTASPKMSKKFDAQLKEARKLHLDGRVESAKKKYEKLLRKQPSNFYLLCFMGSLLIQAKAYKEALGYLERAMAQDNSNPDLMFNLGVAYYHLYDFDKAIEILTINEKVRPEQKEVNLLLALSYFHKEEPDFERSREHCLKELEFKKSPKVLRVLIDICQTVGDFSTSREYAKQLLEIDPVDETALFSIARSLIFEDQKKAEFNYKNIEPVMKMANLMLRNNKESWRAHLLLSEALFLAGESKLSIPHAEKAAQLNPQLNACRVNQSILNLKVGDFQEGYKHLKYRKEKAKLYGMDLGVLDQCGAPFWEGQIEENKHLFIAAEQGIGDQLMHCQFLRKLIQAGMQVSMTVTKKMIPILSRSIPEVSFYSKKEPLPEEVMATVDYKAELMDMMKFLCKDISELGSPFYYLKADQELVQHYINKYKVYEGKLKVGISWGSVSKSCGSIKSTRLEQWGEILRVPGVQFFNVQYLVNVQEVQAVNKAFGVDILLEDFDASHDIEKAAAQLSALDLIISVSNATVHMSGQLQIPTWVILGNRPLWHWFDGTDRSVWYESLKLYRQPQLQGWAPVLSDIAHDLRQLSEQHAQNFLSQDGQTSPATLEYSEQGK